MVVEELQEAGLFHYHQYGSIKGRSALEPVFREVVRAQRALAKGAGWHGVCGIYRVVSRTQLKNLLSGNATRTKGLNAGQVS